MRVPMPSSLLAEVGLSVALAFLQFQFAVWPQDVFVDSGGGWVGAVRTPQVCIHRRFVFPLVCQFFFLLSLPVQVFLSLGYPYYFIHPIWFSPHLYLIL